MIKVKSCLYYYNLYYALGINSAKIKIIMYKAACPSG